jgi:dTDP-4-dehydrorhamnose reductase
MILITGANGQLGQTFRSLISNKQAIFRGRELDITNFELVEDFIAKHSVTAIINAAAYTAVDLAETESALAFHINSFGARNLALISKKFEIPLIHISTDYVFDGTNYRPYVETDTPNPISTYGKSKLEGEEAILELAHSAYIIRTSWLYSGFGKNFLTNITKLALERESLSIVADQIGTPTYAQDLAEVILELLPNLEAGTRQILHYSNQGVASWYDFAYEIINLQNIDCKLTPIPTTSYPTPATRPYYSILDKTLISSLLQSPIPHWRDSLKKHLKAE